MWKVSTEIDTKKFKSGPFLFKLRPFKGEETLNPLCETLEVDVKILKLFDQSQKIQKTSTEFDTKKSKIPVQNNVLLREGEP